MKPIICKKNQVYVPGACQDCTVSCEDFDAFVDTQTQTNTNLAAAIDGKQDELTAGANITINRIDDKTVISSSGGGGGSYTKEELLDILGVREMSMNLVDTDGTTVNCIVLGKRDA